MDSLSGLLYLTGRFIVNRDQTFGISHLLVLTTAIAIMIGWAQLCTFLQYANSAKSPPQIVPIRTFAWASVQGSLLASFVWLVSRRSKSSALLAQPGHWILFLNFLLVPVTLIAHTFFSFQLWQHGDTLPKWVDLLNNFAYALFYPALSLAFAYPILRHWRADCKVWGIVFGLQSIMAAIMGASYLFALTNTSFSIASVAIFIRILIAAMVACAAIVDVVFRVARDWIHWFSVPVSLFAFLANPLIELLAWANPEIAG